MVQAGTLHLVDPDLLGVIESRGSFALTAKLLPLAREGFGLPNVATPDAIRGVDRTVHSAPGWNGDPDVSVRLYRPKLRDAELPCVLHMHGGSFVVGNTAAHEAAHRMLSLDLQCAVVSVECRLAPETPFPGPVDDGYAALTWLWAQAPALGIDRARIGVSGESAGGGLAAGLALLARDRGEFPLLFQHLTYPMIDDRTCTRQDQNAFTGEFIWTRDSNHFGWASFLGALPGSDGISPYAAAARATDLAGLPPTFIATGALDLFVDENVVYATRLMRAGVPTELHVYSGAYHGFSFAPQAAVTLKAQRDSREALSRWFAGSGAT
jgi:acetyl esterase/lipase